VDKYKRNYVLLIQKRDGTTIKITPPFTVEFDIHRNSLSSANVAQIRVFNLSPNNRGQIRKDQFDFGDLRSIAFSAGYGDNLSLAFVGNITQAWSVREGTNMITQIECFDGGYAYVNAVTNDQFPKDTLQSSIIDSLVSKLPGVSKGAIGSFPGQIARGNSYSGSTTDILGQLTGNGFFIDNGKAHCLNDSECLDGDIPLINAQSGLLGTPTLEAQYVNIEMLFEPGLRVGQLIQLETVTADKASGNQTSFNGRHKVLSIKHRGTISDAVCGTAITQVGLLPGAFVPVSVAGAR
jgi:hypothetical protein